MTPEQTARKKLLEDMLAGAQLALWSNEIDEKTLQRLRIAENNTNYDSQLAAAQAIIRAMTQKIGVLKNELADLEKVGQ
jgi:polyhydroxyalkanoate synthesis regulator phasin